MVFVFASFTMINANTSIEKVKSSKLKVEIIMQTCEEEALDIGAAADFAGYSDEAIFKLMNVGYALCMGYSYDDILM